MPKPLRIAILSDVHYAGPAEIERGITELSVISNPLLRHAVKLYRRFIWRRHPFKQNHFLDHFMEEARQADYVIANGDYSCDTAFIGLSDPCSRQSAEQCLAKLRQMAGERFVASIGDHELGKMSLFGGAGGLRIESWHVCQEIPGLKPLWRFDLGNFVLLGVTSSLIALPVYLPETLPEERQAWQKLRSGHLNHIQRHLDSLTPDQHLILFCHDPTALPFLWNETTLPLHADQIDRTIIGHLHSEFFLSNSHRLSGLPVIRFLGTSIQRMSAALREARCWKSFKVALCPALAGIELLKDGGYCWLELDPSISPAPARLSRIRWNNTETDPGAIVR
jgi:hypothetical protein